MSDLLVIEFATEEKAEGVRELLLAMEKEYLVELGDAVVAVKGFGSLDVDGQRGGGSAQRPFAQLPELGLSKKSLASRVPGYDLEERPIPLPPGFELIPRADRPRGKSVGCHGPLEFPSRKQPSFINPSGRWLACSSSGRHLCARLSGYKSLRFGHGDLELACRGLVQPSVC